MIVGALVAGASTALKDTESQAVKDAYQGLKTMVIQHWKAKAKDDTKAEDRARMLFDELEHNPEVYKNPLEIKLNEIIPKPETALIKQAQQLEKLLNEARYSPRGDTINVGDNNNNVQIGNKNTITTNK